MTVYLSLGSNLGDRLGYLAAAVGRLESEQVRVVKVSSVYETAPQGKTDQPAFLNLALQVETDLSPEELLAHIHGVERGLGRVRLERWGPRTIDIDILLYGDRVQATEGLVIPHPRMGERAFVLIPLLELNPDLRWPAPALSPGAEGLGAQAWAPGAPLRAALEALPDQGVAFFLPAGAFAQRVREAAG
jgi:2-amino-4-hydroxy-6-hydroxymethyldihydropteridine diphosphokinase